MGPGWWQGLAYIASFMDPHQDARALLDEYYTAFFGPAAEPLRAFYERAEAHRNVNEGEWYWIKHYLDEAAIELFPAAVLRELRGFIEAGFAAVPADSIYAQRISVVSDAFRFTEYYAALQSARRDLTEAALEQTLSLREKITAFLKARDIFEDYATTLIQDPMHARLEYFMRLNQSDPVPLALAAIVQAGGSLEAGLSQLRGES